MIHEAKLPTKSGFGIYMQHHTDSNRCDNKIEAKSEVFLQKPTDKTFLKP